MEIKRKSLRTVALLPTHVIYLQLFAHSSMHLVTCAMHAGFPCGTLIPFNSYTSTKALVSFVWTLLTCGGGGGGGGGARLVVTW